MKSRHTVLQKTLGKWIAYGYHLDRFSLEVTLDKWHFVICLGVIYFEIEFK